MKRIVMVLVFGTFCIAGLQDAGATKGPAKVQRKRKADGKKQFGARQQRRKMQHWRGKARKQAAQVPRKLRGERGDVRIEEGEGGSVVTFLRDASQPSGWREVPWSEFLATADEATARDFMALFRKLDPRYADQNMSFILSRLPNSDRLLARFGVERFDPGSF